MTTAPIVTLFALPEESGEWRARLRVESVNGRGVAQVVRGNVGGAPVIVAHTGVGAERASRRTAELLAAYQPRAIISAGFAGGLHAEAVVGKVVIDRRGTTCEVPLDCLGGAIVSADHVVELASAKAALGRESGAVAVDMESAAIAAGASAAGVPFLAVRTISDPVETDMPVPMGVWFDREKQAPRVGSLLAFLATHPSRIAPFTRFVRGLAPARRALAHALTEIVLSLHRG